MKLLVFQSAHRQAQPRTIYALGICMTALAAMPGCVVGERSDLEITNRHREFATPEVVSVLELEPRSGLHDNVRSDTGPVESPNLRVVVLRTVPWFMREGVDVMPGTATHQAPKSRFASPLPRSFTELAYINGRKITPCDDVFLNYEEAQSAGFPRGSFRLEFGDPFDSYAILNTIVRRLPENLSPGAGTLIISGENKEGWSARMEIDLGREDPLAYAVSMDVKITVQPPETEAYDIEDVFRGQYARRFFYTVSESW